MAGSRSATPSRWPTSPAPRWRRSPRSSPRSPPLDVPPRCNPPRPCDRRKTIGATMSLPSHIEERRDISWRRDPTLAVASPLDAERFVEQVGFAACLTDARRPGPSLYIAVCGRRDAVMPRNVQTDPETSHTWHLKDDLVRRANVYYGKLAGARTMFIAPRMVRYFHAVWGMRRGEEARRLS